MLYPIVHLDCIHVKSRDAGAVKVKAAYLALGIDLTCNKQLLGLWIAQTEGAKFWLCVVHMVRHSLNYVSWRVGKVVEADLRSVYTAATLEAAKAALDEFEQQWGADYAPIVQS